jgi:exodeoxyribonuclease VII large subunit
MDSPIADSSESRPLSVSQLTDRVKDLLEGSFPAVWVAGEISNLSRPQSGHCYLSIKDERAQLRAVIWRNTAERLSVKLADGMEVICQGALDVYAPRGSYQLVIKKLLPKGEGELQRALRQLRDKLAAEGLFDKKLKKPLPKFPRTIALVTSPTGAAIHDFLQVLRRRWRLADVLVVPVPVQGEVAAAEIAGAIRAVNQIRTGIDVLVVGRGGGSLEDLWAFNEEPVIRAIHASQIPVVSAVGHEIDVTLSDLAADVRALTPSEAAELVVPNEADVAALLASLSQRLRGGLRAHAAAARLRLEAIGSRRVFRKPYERIQEQSRDLDVLATRSARAAAGLAEMASNRLSGVTDRLEALSPLAVLGRGYTLTQRLADGRMITSGSQLKPGEQLVTQFAKGRSISRVEKIEQEP